MKNTPKVRFKGNPTFEMESLEESSDGTIVANLRPIQTPIDELEWAESGTYFTQVVPSGDLTVDVTAFKLED